VAAVLAVLLLVAAVHSRLQQLAVLVLVLAVPVSPAALVLVLVPSVLPLVPVALLLLLMAALQPPRLLHSHPVQRMDSLLSANGWRMDSLRTGYPPVQHQHGRPAQSLLRPWHCQLFEDTRPAKPTIS
jgi:hypothetical protein